MKGNKNKELRTYSFYRGQCDIVIGLRRVMLS